MDIVKKMGDIKRRLQALKAERNVQLNQIAFLEEEWDFNITLAASITATFELTIVCGDHPIVIAAIDGYAADLNEILPRPTEWAISGSTSTATLYARNNAATSKSATITIKAWALNGLSATCERTS